MHHPFPSDVWGRWGPSKSEGPLEVVAGLSARPDYISGRWVCPSVGIARLIRHIEIVFLPPTNAISCSCML